MKPLPSSLFCLLLPFVFVCPASVNAQSCTNSNPAVEGQCASISGLDCADFYPRSYFPNNITLSIQDAVTQVTSYQRFFNARESCSEYLDAFLCLATLPNCEMEGGLPVVRMPCRTFCAQVVSDCSSVIESIGGAQFDALCIFVECSRYVRLSN